ncbi:inner membrane protein YbjJ [Acinetobacter calcoaceticus]
MSENTFLTRARVATSFMFLINGMVLAIWATNIPGLKTSLGINDAQLGVALSNYAIGTMLTSYFAGLLATKFGTRNILILGGILLSLALPLSAYASNYFIFAATIFILGSFNSIYDVSMNSHACMIEEKRNKVLMPSFHALFSFGGLFGASTVAVLLSDQLGTKFCLTLAGCIVFLATMLSAYYLGDIRPATQESNASFKLRFPNKALMGLACLSFLALFIERVYFDWSALYLTEVGKVSANIAALGFAGFSFAMAISRLSGTYLVNKFGEIKTLITSGSIGICGVLLAIVIPNPIVAICGFVLAGLGCGNMIPVFFSRSCKVYPEAPAVGLAICGMFGYLGYLAAPLVIGNISNATNLKTALLVPVIAFVIIILSHLRVKKTYESKRTIKV